MGESKTTGWAGEEVADVERDPGLGQLLQVPWIVKGAEVPLPLGLRTPAPQICVKREKRDAVFRSRGPQPQAPKLEGKYLLSLRTRYKLILNTDALFFLLCSDRNAVANLDML